MSGDAKRETWLLIKKNDEEAQAAAAGDFLDGLSFSVKSGIPNG